MAMNNSKNSEPLPSMEEDTVASIRKEEQEGNEGVKQLAFDSEHRLRSENLAFDIDVWAPIFLNAATASSNTITTTSDPSIAKPITARSVFLPLTLQEAKAIRAFHDVSWRNCRIPPLLTLEEVEILQRLAKDLDDTLKKHFTMANGEGCCAFVRLCGRSPKDGDPFDFERIRQEYKAAVVEVLAEQKQKETIKGEEKVEGEKEEGKGETTIDEVNIYTLDPLIKLQAIARVNPLKVTSGRDVLQLLLTSERVYADMIDWINYGEPEQIVLREYNPEVRLDYEFRLFVCHGQVTAISQYDHHAYYPHLDQTSTEESVQERLNELEEGLMNCWREVHRILTGETGGDGESEGDQGEGDQGESNKIHRNMSYVADIAYLPKSKQYVLLEISPFSPCTGAALFSWSRDKDLLEGKVVGGDEVIDGASTGVEREGDGDGDGNEALQKKKKNEQKKKPVFRTKRLDDLHPQLNDLIQWNWEDRWFNPLRQSLPYTKYFQDTFDAIQEEKERTMTTTRRHTPQTARDGESSSLWQRLFCFFGGSSTASSYHDDDRLVGSGEVDLLHPSASPVVSSSSRSSDGEVTLLPTAIASTTTDPTNTSMVPDETLSSSPKTALLFVYGTLKTGFHWNSKYLSSRLGASFVCEAKTVDPFPLVIGDCGVPYLLGDLPGEGHCIEGELWQVDDIALRGLDDYEGLSKGYYSRRSIQVVQKKKQQEEGNGKAGEEGEDQEGQEGKNASADVYVLSRSTEELRSRPFLSVYPKDAPYRPIEHIQVKQVAYYKTASSWGKTNEVIVTAAPTH